MIEETQKHKTRIFKMKDVTFNCHITQEYINDLLNEIFDYQSVIPSVGSDGKYHWLYIIINKTNGHFFIGRRSKLNYLVGLNVSRQKELQEDFQKLGPNAFLRYDLHYYNSYEEMMMNIEDMFGDDFIEYFHKQRGTCYNARSMMISSKMISTKEHGEDVSSRLELVKPVDGSKPIDTIDFTNSKKFFHHWMTRKDEAVCVPNAECLKYIENGFVFRSLQLELYKGNERLNPSIAQSVRNEKDAKIKAVKLEAAKHDLAQRMLDYFSQGWSLAKDWKSSKERLGSRREKIKLRQENNMTDVQSVPDVKSIQLSLDLEVKQPEVKQPEPKSKKIRTIVIQKDGDLKSIFLEELIDYLKRGYFVVRDTIKIKRGEYTKTLLMTSKQEYAQSAEDKISMRKIKSLQLLGYLENGWEIA